MNERVCLAYIYVMQNIPFCPICKHTKNVSQFANVNSYKYYNCANCTTTFLFPIPSKKQFDELYSNDYGYQVEKISEERIVKRAKIIVRNLIRMNPNGKTLLDIGSGFGFFLNEAGKQGLKTVGIEPAKNLSSYSKKHFNALVYGNTLDEFIKNNTKKKFDFITLVHVIEHTENPSKFLAQALRLLKKGGTMFVETPNIKSRLFYSERERYTFLTPPDHTTLLSTNSFRRIIGRLKNMKIVKHKTYSYPEHFAGIIKKSVLKQQIPNTSSNSQTELARNRTPAGASFTKRLKYFIFDVLICRLLVWTLNLGEYGSFLELYIKKI